MTGLLLALLLFGALAAAANAVSTRDGAGTFDDVPPRRTPDPGPRDLHAVGSTLGRAPVPSWG